MADQILRIKDTLGNIYDIAIDIPAPISRKGILVYSYLDTTQYQAIQNSLDTISADVDKAIINNYNSITGVIANTTDTLVSFTAASDYSLVGFTVSGDADGRFSLRIGSDEKYVIRTSVSEQSKTLILPFPDKTAAGQPILLEVTNNGSGVGAYDASVLGI